MRVGVGRIDRIGRGALSLGWAVCLVAVLSACQVRPLYAPDARGVGAATEFARIDVAPVEGRAGQALRNELLLMLNSGHPAGIDYVLALNVRHRERETLLRHADGEPQNRIVQLQAGYRLTRTGDDAPLLDGSVTRMATYEVSRQRFANDRAALNALDRAAREAAEAIRLRLATFFASGGATRSHPSPALDVGEDLLDDDRGFLRRGERADDGGT